MNREFAKSLPPVHEVLKKERIASLIPIYGHETVANWVRCSIESARNELAKCSGSDSVRDRREWLSWIGDEVSLLERRMQAERLAPVINATGVVLHTSLGRAPLSEKASQALLELSGSCNLEVDLQTGQRRYRGHQVSSAFRMLTGCEDVLIVNNNAAATLLVLQCLCAGREVVISRGQLIEIGGSFRLPEIFQLSGAVLREVGTTNRTHVADYSKAMSPQTAALMHVHPSNYRVIGFAETPSVNELVPISRQHGVLMIDDLGSGSLVDVKEFGLPAEPTFQQSLAAGADVVLGSGDKLLGGPQCGIILGRSDLIERLRQHPLARAMRVDKLTLAALQATLDAYLRGTAVSEVPTLKMLATSLAELRSRAEKIVQEIGGTSLHIRIAEDVAAVGGGALPGAELPTIVLRLSSGNKSADEISAELRLGAIRVMARIQQSDVLIDLRSVQAQQDQRLAEAIRSVSMPSATSEKRSG